MQGYNECAVQLVHGGSYRCQGSVPDSSVNPTLFLHFFVLFFVYLLFNFLAASDFVYAASYFLSFYI